LGAVVVGIVAPAQRIEAAVELALEPVDDRGIEPSKAVFMEQSIKSILPLN